MRVISGHMGWVRALAVDPSNEWFASGGGDRLIKVGAKSMARSVMCLISVSDPDLGPCFGDPQTFLDGTHIHGARTCDFGTTPLSFLLWRG